MAQVYIFGASSAYGVGAEHSGWGDLLKQYLHSKMYSSDGIGEKHEVFNFAYPGAGADFVIVTAREQLKFYRRSGKVIAVISVGGNNSKAEETPDNFVSTVEEYKQLMSQLIERMKEDVDEVILVGSGAVDEAKTNPKPNPLTGGKSYFTNARREMFEHKLVEVCRKHEAHFVPVDVTPDEWRASYLYKDGLHPNQKGHEYIARQVWTVVENLIGD
ncbi:MAG TPA: GDSL-type esterase/lipase family protein [Candidatus Saccharimonadales bacterium]|nr:GDSL-type esterase/lipase family protein [Candidatus Saccharimonadales bacterium]